MYVDENTSPQRHLATVLAACLLACGIRRNEIQQKDRTEKSTRIKTSIKTAQFGPLLQYHACMHACTHCQATAVLQRHVIRVWGWQTHVVGVSSHPRVPMGFPSAFTPVGLEWEAGKAIGSGIKRCSSNLSNPQTLLGR